MALLWVYLRAKFFAFSEGMQTLRLYFHDVSCIPADLALRLHYLVDTPYHVCRRYLQLRGYTDIYAYGHTPLPVLQKICRWASLSCEDTVLDLGCGAGFTSFWMRMVYGCQVIGVEQIPEFVAFARQLRAKRGIEKLEFVQNDLLQAPFERASFVYLYGSCLPENYLRFLSQKIAGLPSGARVISISYALKDYGAPLKVVDEKLFRFPWGKAKAYLQMR